VDIELIAIVLGVILVSMTLHEVMHGFAAYWLGDDTAKHQGRLTLNPIKHIDPFMTILLPVLLALSGGPIFGGAKPVPFNPTRLRYGEWGVALVAVAGPLTNLLIAFLSFGVLALLGDSIAAPDGGPSIIGTILLLSVQVNLGFFAFNMLPIPPLDGSRVLYALAPDFVRRGMEEVERFGVIVVFMVVFFANSLLASYMIGVIGFFFDLFSALFSIS
jgi:Zn-dependent protease